MSKQISLINGPNLNLLGERNKEIYGSETLQDIVSNVETYAKQAEYSLHAIQSNSEGDIIDSIHKAAKDSAGIIINPGALSHTSIAIRDAVEAVSVPVIEVHISNIFGREEFRQHSFVSEVADGVIAGLGCQGYILAFGALLQKLR